MPKLHYVKKARKDNRVVKAGEPYYWWQFAFSAKNYSKTRPNPSQLTGSEFMREYLSMGEDFEEAVNDVDTIQGLADAREDLMSRIDELRDETQGKFDNMPEQFQDAETGQMMQERIDGLESWRDELESVDLEDWDPEEIDPEADAKEALGEWLMEKAGEMAGLDPGLY